MIAPMRILQLHNLHQAGGGAGIVVERERRLLEDAGHMVHTHLERSLDHVDRSRSQQAIISVWNRSAHRAVGSAIEDFKPDVVHLHTPFPFLSPSVVDAASQARVPVVMTSHSYRLACVKGTMERDGSVCSDCIGSRMRLPAIKNRCYRDSALMSSVLAAGSVVHAVRGTFTEQISIHLALTSYMRQLLIDDGIPAERILVHPNFVPDPVWEQPLPGDRAGYVFVGRITPEKGVASLVEAWRLLGPAAPPLTIIGDGPALEALKVEASPSITFTGEVENREAQAAMAAAKALIFPSIWPEGLGLSWVEALATATPVIYSDVGNFSTLLDELGCGERVRSGSAESLAAAVRAFEDLDADGRSVLGRAARRGFEAHFTAERALARLEQAYRQAGWFLSSR